MSVGVRELPQGGFQGPRVVVNLPTRTIQEGVPGAQEAPMPVGARPSLGIRIGGQRLKALEPAEGIVLEAQEKSREYVRRVLGRRFVENKLDFKPAFSLADGRTVYGVMENARIALSTFEDQVAKGVARHEVAHYVMDHLIDRESRWAIEDEVYAKLEQTTGTRPSMEAVNEHIASQFERGIYDTSTLLGRFLSWLKAVMRRWGVYRSRMEDLFLAIEEGTFVGREPNLSEVEPRYSARETNSDDWSERAVGLAMGKLDEAVQIIGENTTASRAAISQARRMDLARLLGGEERALFYQRLIMRKMVSETVWGNFAPSVDLQSPPPDLPNALLEFHQTITEDAKGLPGSVVIDGVERNYAELALSDLPRLTATELDDWSLYQLAQPAVYAKLIAAIAPSAPIRLAVAEDGTLHLEGPAPVVELAFDGDTRMNDFIYAENDERNFLEGQGWITRLMLQDLRAIDGDNEASTGANRFIP
ncbi:MAG TPA: hypothetical protein PK735_11475, partial [Flavobacteriales bacterium]|nr:hypothetical protein [Flavobacteriales bacterium]